MVKIALLEDEAEWADIVVRLCAAEGWVCHWLKEVSEMQAALSSEAYDCLVADIDLGEHQERGVSLVHGLRKSGFVIPIMVFTQFAEKYRAGASLDYGADDYLAKPFDSDEFCARVRALVRRTSLGDPASLTAGPLQISRQYRSAFWYNERMDLRGQGFDILALLAEHDGRVVSHDMIWSCVWSKWKSLPLQIQPIQAGISRLRRDIAAVTSTNLVVTVPGVGYRLNFD